MKHIQTDTSTYINLRAQLWQGIYNDDQRTFNILFQSDPHNNTNISQTQKQQCHTNSTQINHSRASGIPHTLYNTKIL